MQHKNKNPCQNCTYKILHYTLHNIYKSLKHGCIMLQYYYRSVELIILIYGRFFLYFLTSYKLKMWKSYCGIRVVNLMMQSLQWRSQSSGKGGDVGHEGPPDRLGPPPKNINYPFFAHFIFKGPPFRVTINDSNYTEPSSGPVGGPWSHVWSSESELDPQ